MRDLLQAAGPTIALAAPTNQALEKLSVEQAITIIRPIYNALTASSPENIRAQLEGATTADWQNCGSNDTCEDRESAIQRWSGRIAQVPDFSFEIKDVVSDGSKIVVRSEAKGTPAGDFLGIAHSGRSFRIMSVDIHEIKDGRVARTFHVEDWAGAMRQLGGK